MKKIIFLLLLITSVSYGQAIAPTRVKITNNAISTTAPFIATQETDGFINKINKFDLIDVIEYASAVNLPVTGVAGKIYVTKDNGKIYRWNGTYYTELAITDISGKVDKIVGKGLSTEDYTTPEKTKLAELFNYDPTTINNAVALKVDKVTGKSLLSDTEITRLTTLSNYTHPANHPPSIITQDASNRFVTDAEKTAWNAKQSNLGYTPENVANKSDSYSVSSTVTYPSTKALVDGLGTKISGTLTTNRIPKSFGTKSIGDSSINDNGTTINTDLPIHANSFVKSIGSTNLLLASGSDITQASLPISTATQTALNGKENSFTKNTAFNKNFGTTAGTVAQGNDSRINNGQTAFGWGNHAGLYPTLTGSGANGTWGINISGTAASSNAWNGLQFVGDEQPVGAYSIGYGVDGKFHYATAQAYKNWLGLGSNAYTSTAYLPIASTNSLNTWSYTNGFYGLHGSSVGMPSTSSYWSGIRTVLPNDSGYGLEITANIDENELYFRRYAVNYKSWQKLWHDGNFNPANYLPLSGGTLSGAISGTSATFSETVTASLATLPNHVVVKSQLDAVGRPYKVYTALLNQTGTDAPVATVLENTLGGTISWSRFGTGVYDATLSSGSFTANKTTINVSRGDVGTTVYSYGNPTSTVGSVRIVTADKNTTNPPTDSRFNNTFFEIRLYN